MSEISKALVTLKAMFPTQLTDEKIVVYARLLSDLPDDEVLAAVDVLIRDDSRFLPAISDIRQRVAETQLGLLDPQEAWDALVRRWGYRRGSGNPDSWLSPEVTETIRSMGLQPYDFWTDERPALTEKRFKETYEAICERAIRQVKIGRSL